MFVTFKDLLGFAAMGFLVTLFFAAFGAFSLLVPLMMIVLGAAAVFCGRMR
jgi:hypothetical protein